MMTLVLFPESTDRRESSAIAEHRIAVLADASYQVALKNGLSGSFLDTRLGIWEALRNVEQSSSVVSVRPNQNTGEFAGRFAGIA
ncbi:MAG: hypothetical protein KF861_11915 [Planctomycetaceae bacterium]|nr:hypothetical protein [Planctomycetaceae bacterium]